MLNQKFFILTILLLTLTSCGYTSGVIQNRDKEYLSAQSIPPLKMPPGLSSATIQSRYPVSERDYPESKQEVNLLPPDLN